MTEVGGRRWRSARPVAALRQGRNDWFRIENKSAALAKVYIYDEIGYFGVTASDFVAALSEVEAPKIELHLNTPGGEVWEGLAIYNALIDHPAAVDVIVDSIAASAGSFIAMAGDTIAVQRNAEMMIHDAMGLVIGNSADMAEMVDMLDRTSDNIAGIYAARAGGTAAGWRELMRAETWFSAQEAVDAGLADEVRGKSEGKDDPANKWDLSIYAHAGRREAPAPNVTRQPVAVVEDLSEVLKGAFA